VYTVYNTMNYVRLSLSTHRILAPPATDYTVTPKKGATFFFLL